MSFIHYEDPRESLNAGEPHFVYIIMDQKITLTSVSISYSFILRCRRYVVQAIRSASVILSTLVD